MIRPLLAISAVALLCVGCSSIDVEPIHNIDVADDHPRVLAVIAHPDDEAAFAGALYKTATHLGGACDLLVITNGEGGYKYSTQAELIYDEQLTDPEVGRAELPAIRKQELMDAAQILRIRQLFLLGEPDRRFTLEADDMLGAEAEVWDLDRIREALRWVLERNRYDFVFLHRPTPRNHGHHQAATILTLAAIEDMPFEIRPVPLAVGGTWAYDQDEVVPDELPGYPITALRPDTDPFYFDRRQRFGHKDALDYAMIVRLAAYAHRTQGSYLMHVGHEDREVFWMFELLAPDDEARCLTLFTKLAERQFATPGYEREGQTAPTDRTEVEASAH